MTDRALDRGRRRRMVRTVALFWLALSALWAVVVIVTDTPAWPLAVWIGITLGPLAILQRRIDPIHARHMGTDEGEDR